MSFEIGEGCQIHPTARIDVKHGSIGPRSIIREGVIIEGSSVVIGAEAYLDIRARIGGGSCFGIDSFMTAGDFLHMGVDSHINTARPVTLGDEVGVGVETKIWTHGAYLGLDMGFPVQWEPVWIGSRVWLPNAWVNPGVTIGNDVVVAAKSLVNRDIPDGSLCGGIPARVIRSNCYPKFMSEEDIGPIFFKIFTRVKRNRVGPQDFKTVGQIPGWREIIRDDIGDREPTQISISMRKIEGAATEFTEALLNELRRNGIRFRYYAKDGVYVPW
jgi:acetyltransferase-like isoleucine patch superfamily enzyme